MRSLIFIILAGYAVKCDDASYYVIEIPEDVPREYAKPMRVYWNVPTFQCQSKKIPFDSLFQKYGIIQNSGDSFRGDKVAILYDPGLFPALLVNETNQKLVPRNGGVPQEGDLDKHLIAFRDTLDQSIPDQEFSGIGIIDFESWRPVFRQNFGVLTPYKDFSYQVERKLHWWWTERAIKARAQQRFEEAAREFMQTTISVAKQMRPRALWGYYGFPYCFNMASSNMKEGCAAQVPQENDKISWLWFESTALYPSVYSSNELSTSQLSSLVRGRVAEAARVKRQGTPVLPYFWFRYREGGYLTETDLDAVLETLYKSDASGFIIWGGSSDVNTAEKCENLLKYTTDVLGPAIAKYTKGNFLRNTTDETGTFDSVSNSVDLTNGKPVLNDHLDSNSSKKTIFLDPEYHWEPPENYSQDIAHSVEQEFKKKPNYNADKENQTVLTNSKTDVLLEMILNFFENDKENVGDATTVKNDVLNLKDEDVTSPKKDVTGAITINNYVYSHSTEGIEHPNFNIVTKNPLDVSQYTIKPNSSTDENFDQLNTTIFLDNYASSETPVNLTTENNANYSQSGSSKNMFVENGDVENSQVNIYTTIDDTDSTTETSLNTKGTTSHTISFEPANKIVNLSTMALEEAFEVKENIFTSSNPDVSLESTTIFNRDNIIPLDNVIIEPSFTHSQDIETSTKKEFDIYEYDYIFRLDYNESTTENTSTVSKSKAQNDNSTTIKEKENLDMDVRNSTNGVSTETESSTLDTLSTADVFDNREYVPDSTEDFSVKTSTESELTSTTDEDVQVVVFL